MLNIYKSIAEHNTNILTPLKPHSSTTWILHPDFARPGEIYAVFTMTCTHFGLRCRVPSSRTRHDRAGPTSQPGSKRHRWSHTYVNMFTPSNALALSLEHMVSECDTHTCPLGASTPVRVCEHMLNTAAVDLCSMYTHLTHARHHL